MMKRVKEKRRETEEEKSRRRGSKSWGSPPPESDSFTLDVESLFCTPGNICACKHTLKRLCIVLPVSLYYKLGREVIVCHREVGVWVGMS